jgi:hypothetical protein
MWKSEVPNYSLQSDSKRAKPEVSIDTTVPVQNVLDFYAGKENFITRIGTKSDLAMRFFYRGFKYPYTVRMDNYGRIHVTKPKESEAEPVHLVFSVGVRLA